MLGSEGPLSRFTQGWEKIAGTVGTGTKISGTVPGS